MNTDETNKKVIINLAPVGMVPRKDQNPHVPVTAEEIGADIAEAARLGVSMVHLHAREADGAPTYRKDAYARVIERVREAAPEMVVVASTSGRMHPEFDKRAEVLSLDGDLKPDMASLTLGSLNFARSESINSIDTIARLAERMGEMNIKPELEVFDMGMVNVAHYLIKKGIIEPPYYFNIFIGNIMGLQTKLLHLGAAVAELPENSYWCTGGIGNSKNLVGILFGHGVRVGLEDNIWHDCDRTVLASNKSLVQRAVKMAELTGREIATPADTRALLGLPLTIGI
jgi:uncharacterized protein (DUF849 family)